MSQPTPPPHKANSSSAAHDAITTIDAAPGGISTRNTSLHNGNTTLRQPYTTYPANFAAASATADTVRQTTTGPTTPPVPMKSTKPRRSFYLPPSGDGDDFSTATWGPSIFNLVSRAQGDPAFDLSAHPTYIIENPMTTPRFQRHDLANTWYFRGTNGMIRVFYRRTWMLVNWGVIREDGTWEVRWGDMPQVGK